MSNKQLRRYNITNMVVYNEITRMIDTAGDSWYFKNNTLYHNDNRNKRGNVTYHFQCKVKSFSHALGYIKGHSMKLYRPRKCRMEMLFDMI